MKENQEVQPGGKWGIFDIFVQYQNKLLYRYSWIVAPYIMREMFFNA
jgi:hypothetical protein